LILIAVGSEGNKSRKLAEKYGFEYHEVENNVTKKYNKCFSEAKKHNVDACIKVDSDSIISSKFFQYWNKCINSGVDYSEVLDIWFLFQDSYCLWGGYTNHRKGEGTGVGRFLSKKLLNILNWQPMGKDSYVSNDLEMTKVIRGIKGITTEAVTCDIGCIIDIKSNEQITDLSKAEYSVIEGIEKAPIDITPIKQHLLVSGLKKKKYSIVIPAYNCVDYIEQCLDSIENQTYFKKNNEFEVLVGVDGCQKTLSKILKIKHKYRNLRVFEFGTNKGCYVTLNSLILASNYDNICIFGADDWAYDTAINEYSKLNEMLIRNKFTWVQNGKIGKTSDFYGYGGICMQRKLFDLMGGYIDWRCSGDYEFLERMPKDIKVGYIEKPLVFHRKHKEQLTSNKDFGMSTEYRKKVNAMVKKEYKKIVPVTNQYFEVK
jgi:hypothetical protein